MPITTETVKTVLSAIAAKGHVGITALSLIEVMEAKGINPRDVRLIVQAQMDQGRIRFGKRLRLVAHEDLSK